MPDYKMQTNKGVRWGGWLCGAAVGEPGGVQESAAQEVLGAAEIGYLASAGLHAVGTHHLICASFLARKLAVSASQAFSAPCC